MMKTSTKLSVAVAASMLGVALAASGAYAATGALTTRDAPGQVLPVTGVGATSDHATQTWRSKRQTPISCQATARQRMRQSSVRRHDDAHDCGAPRSRSSRTPSGTDSACISPSHAANDSLYPARRSPTDDESRHEHATESDRSEAR